jgi:hypothetical protein
LDGQPRTNWRASPKSFIVPAAAGGDHGDRSASLRISRSQEVAMLPIREPRPVAAEGTTFLGGPVVDQWRPTPANHPEGKAKRTTETRVFALQRQSFVTEDS